MLNTGPAPCERGGPFDPVCVSFSTVPSQRDSNTFNERPEGLLGSRMPDDVEDKTSSHNERKSSNSMDGYSYCYFHVMVYYFNHKWFFFFRD